MTPPIVRVQLHAENDLRHLALLLGGLTQLHEVGRIRLQIGTAPAPKRPYQTVYRLLAEGAGGDAPVAITVDLGDGSDFSDASSLESSGFYFKRSLWSDRIPRLKATSAAVHPFGMNSSCHEVGFVCQFTLLARAMQLLVGQRGSASATRGRLHRLRKYLRLPRCSSFQPRDDRPPEMKVVFQTRLWARSEAPDEDVERLNQERAAIAVALRKAFGSRFLGGVIRSEQADAICPEAISKLPTGNRAYAEWSRNALVGVYTRGLHNSVAMKLTEYLAGAKAIVAEPLPPTLVLPAAFEESVAYLPFRSASECVAACDRLLTRPQDAAELSSLSAAYYRNYCSPRATASRLLRTVGIAAEP